jgi:hypothetical protein
MSNRHPRWIWIFRAWDQLNCKCTLFATICSFWCLYARVCTHACHDELALIFKRNSLACSFSNGVKHRSLNCCCGPSEEGLESLREEFSRVPSNSSGKTSDGSGGGSPIAALQRKPTDGVSHHTGAPYPIAASHPKDSSLDTVVSSDSLDLGSRSFEGCLGQFENEVRFDQCPRC